MQYIFALLVLFIGGGFLLHRFIRRVVVFEYERGLLFRSGRFERTLEPGIYWYTTLSRMITKLDMRPRFVSISSQEILSADNISLKLSLAANYTIVDPYRALQSSQDYQEALYILLQLNLRSVVSTLTMDDLLANRQAISAQLLALSTEPAQALGLQLFSTQIKDITFPGDLKRVFAQVLKAQKEGLAALEKARGESAALRNLANAARMLDNNPSLLQLRALLAVSESTGNTVVVTVPPATSSDAVVAQRASSSTSSESPPPEH